VKKSDIDPIEETYSELKEGIWLKNAQHRSSRRRSAWNLLLPVLAIPFWLGLAYALIKIARITYAELHPGNAELRHPSSVHIFLIAIPIFVASISPAFIGANFLVYRLPAARRALEQEDRQFPEVDYPSSQRALIRVGAVIAGIAVVLIALGILLG
jgi:hypothetical protein